MKKKQKNLQPTLKDLYKEISYHLTVIRSRDNSDRQVGICTLLGEEIHASVCSRLADIPDRDRNIFFQNLFNSALVYIKIVQVEWPKYSGNELYPVPHPFSKWLPFDPKELAFRRYVAKKPMWTGSYGKLRKEFLDFLIARIDSSIEAA